jgi:heat shock protein HtpX
MITALRKIEGRGELEGATSAVMEMCVDNPREGFADLFATHPSVDSRIAALVNYAGGHDPGPIAMLDGGAVAQLDPSGRGQLPPPSGPWSDAKAPGAGSQGPWARLRGPWGRR